MKNENSSGIWPLTGLMEDVSVLTVDEDDFAPIFDAPFVTVAQIEGQFQAEVILSGDPAVDRERIQTALDVGAKHHVSAFAGTLLSDTRALICFAPVHPPFGGKEW